MRATGLMLLLLAGVATPAVAQQAAPAKITVPPIAFKERTLADGLRVIAIRDTTTPNVTVQVWYDVGSKHDPEGRSGFAHLFYSTLSARADAGMIVASPQTKNESATDVVAIFARELDRLGKEPLDAETVAQRKAFVSGGLSRQTESSRGLAALIAGLVQQGLPPAEAAQVERRIDTVTPASATAAGKRVSAGDAVIVVVGDAQLFADKRRGAYPGLTVIPAAQLDLGAAGLVAK